MGSIITESSQPALSVPAGSQRSRMDRLAAATLEQMQSALRFLTVFEPDAFDHAMDIAQCKDGLPADNQPGAAGEAEPLCGICGAPIGIFPNTASPGSTTPGAPPPPASPTSTTQATPPQ